MLKQDPRIFRTDDALSAWTERLAQAISYPSMQFDTRSSGRVRTKSRLYYHVVPHGYMCLDVYSPSVVNVNGCVVFVIASDRDDYPMVVVPSNDDFTPAIDAFEEVATSLPVGQRLAEPGETIPERRDGLDDRQLIELGRELYELRTGSLFPRDETSGGRPRRKRGRSPHHAR